MSGKRNFRSAESLNAEAGRRNALAPFLTGHGYTVVEDRRRTHGVSAVEQIIHVVNPEGRDMLMRVRLCWQRRGQHSAEHLFSAAQLAATLRKGKDHEGTVASVRDRAATVGITHVFFAQDDERGRIISAALVPIEALPEVWKRQRAAAEMLLGSPHAGRTTANQVLNGRSPTIWLMDDRRPDSHRIADALWTFPGVIRLGPVPDGPAPAPRSALDDLAPDPDLLGRDEAEATLHLTLSYARDPEVRRAVLRRAKGCCERPGCGASRLWSGFLDVHHVLGVAESDRLWNCVALCPSCHREAHFAPDRDQLNRILLGVAKAT